MSRCFFCMWLIRVINVLIRVSQWLHEYSKRRGQLCQSEIFHATSTLCALPTPSQPAPQELELHRYQRAAQVLNHSVMTFPTVCCFLKNREAPQRVLKDLKDRGRIGEIFFAPHSYYSCECCQPEMFGNQNILLGTYPRHPETLNQLLSKF